MDSEVRSPSGALARGAPMPGDNQVPEEGMWPPPRPTPRGQTSQLELLAQELQREKQVANLTPPPLPNAARRRFI